MLTHERVVVSNDATCLGVILIIVEFFESEVSEFSLVLLDIENIGIGVHIFKSVGVHLKEFLEPLKTNVKF